jgi:hypothetical protein
LLACTSIDVSGFTPFLSQSVQNDHGEGKGVDSGAGCRCCPAGELQFNSRTAIVRSSHLAAAGSVPSSANIYNQVNWHLSVLLKALAEQGQRRCHGALGNVENRLL